ncbi:MAG: DUF3108 domain-containing protein [Candidatus Eiseniibacteriota bacterium]
MSRSAVRNTLVAAGLLTGVLGVLAAGVLGLGASARAARAADPDPAPASVQAPEAAAPGMPVVNTVAGRNRGLPFGPGESLRFSIEYGLVKAGTAWLEVGPMQKYRGRDCYHLISRAESNEFMSKIYKVRDRIDSLVDAEGLFTYRYRKRIREGTYEKDYDILYDPGAGRARYADGQTLDTKLWPKDGLAAFYYVRHMPLEVGKDIELAHHSDRRSNDIIVKVHGRERVEVPAGTFDCLIIEPVMEAGGLFKSSGKLLIYVTDDERRIPVLMKSKIPVGSVDAVLQEIRRGGPTGSGPAPGRTPAQADATGF